MQTLLKSMNIFGVSRTAALRRLLLSLSIVCLNFGCRGNGKTSPQAEFSGEFGRKVKCAFSKVVPQLYRDLWIDLMGTQISRNLITHYIDCNGQSYKLSPQEMANLQAELFDNNRDFALAKKIASAFLTEWTENKNADEIVAPLEAITLAWSDGGTLGNFTVRFNGRVKFSEIKIQKIRELEKDGDLLQGLTAEIGKLTAGNHEHVLTGTPIDRQGLQNISQNSFARWEYAGEMTYFDHWDFNTKPFRLSDWKNGTWVSQGRSELAELRALIAHFLLPGSDFDIESAGSTEFLLKDGVLEVVGYENQLRGRPDYSPYGKAVIEHLRGLQKELRSDDVSAFCKLQSVAGCWNDLKILHERYAGSELK